MRAFFDQRQLAHAPLRELHNGDWTDYAETAARAQSVAAQLACEPVRDFGVDPILAVHDAAYIEFLNSAWRDWKDAGRPGDAIPYVFPVVGRRDLPLDRIDARLGRYSMDAATPIAEHSWDAAYWSAQTALTALHSCDLRPGGRSFALCRPPGHHAGPDYMGGYCYLNNAAIAARQAAKDGLGPIAILDIDYHHGNGTQDIFLSDPDVFFASIHADPKTDFPFYWGHADERGEGDGFGTTLNLPLSQGTQWAAYQIALDKACDAITLWGARTLIVSFGADTFAGDPISSFKLTRKDFAQLGARISQLALPTITVMEGGYAVGDLGKNVAIFLDGLNA